MIDNFMNDIKAALNEFESFMEEKNSTVKLETIIFHLVQKGLIKEANSVGMTHIVREYIKGYSEYESVRGVNGGIRKKSAKNETNNKSKIKKLVQAKIAAVGNTSVPNIANQKPIEISIPEPEKSTFEISDSDEMEDGF